MQPSQPQPPPPKELKKLQPMRNVEEFGPRYVRKNQIGSGSHGDVFEALDKETGRIVAIKQFKRLFENKFIALRALREVTLLRVINFPKIIKIYQILPPKDEKNFDTLAVALEYMPYDLKRICGAGRSLQDREIENILYQLVVALRYLKSAKILHRDLKPENILISKDLSEVKICDFGLARPITAYEQPKEVDRLILDSLKEEGEHDKQEERKKDKLTFHVVTRWYRAPEIILLQSEYGNAIEMWSVGCIFAELINNHGNNRKVSNFNYKPIFEGKACFPLSPPKKELVDTYKNFNGFPHSEDDQMQALYLRRSKIINVIGTPDEQDIDEIKDQYARAYMKSFPKRQRKNFRELFVYAKPQWIDFLERTLVFNPKKRMTIAEALQHPIFKEVRNKELEIDTTQAFTNLSLHSGLSMEEIRARFLDQIRYHQNKVMVGE